MENWPQRSRCEFPALTPRTQEGWPGGRPFVRKLNLFRPLRGRGRRSGRGKQDELRAQVPVTMSESAEPTLPSRLWSYRLVTVAVSPQCCRVVAESNALIRPVEASM